MSTNSSNGEMQVPMLPGKITYFSEKYLLRKPVRIWKTEFVVLKNLKRQVEDKKLSGC